MPSTQDHSLIDGRFPRLIYRLVGRPAREHGWAWDREYETKETE